jgi:hypothetical protein
VSSIQITPAPLWLKPIVTPVRGWAELHMSRNRPLYHPGLLGLCAVCSARIHTRLKKRGLPSQIVEGFAHVFVLTGPWLIDVTATQFSPRFPKILITHYSTFLNKLPPTRLRSHWQIERRHTSLDSLLQSQIENDWPDEQLIPTSYLTAKTTL